MTQRKGLTQVPLGVLIPDSVVRRMLQDVRSDRTIHFDPPYSTLRVPPIRDTDSIMNTRHSCCAPKIAEILDSAKWLAEVLPKL